MVADPIPIVPVQADGGEDVPADFEPIRDAARDLDGLVPLMLGGDDSVIVGLGPSMVKLLCSSTIVDPGLTVSDGYTWIS